MKKLVVIFLGFAVLAAIFGFTSLGMANDSVSVGAAAPEFELADQNGQLHSLEDYRDQWVVLYFYPKDETPGCTTEACEFRDNIFAFRELNAQVIGVSLDDAESHKAFAENHGLPFPLLADVDGITSSAYGVKTRMLGMEVARRQTAGNEPDGNGSLRCALFPAGLIPGRGVVTRRAQDRRGAHGALQQSELSKIVRATCMLRA